MLDDGDYDALVVDGDVVGPDAVRLELTITAGPHKGELVSVRATGLGADPVDLLGLPARLSVAGGEPRVELER